MATKNKKTNEKPDENIKEENEEVVDQIKNEELDNDVKEDTVTEPIKIKVELIANVKYGPEIKRIGDIIEVTPEEYERYSKLQLCKAK